jgi:hypothetical protein
MHTSLKEKTILVVDILPNKKLFGPLLGLKGWVDTRRGWFKFLFQALDFLGDDPVFFLLRLGFANSFQEFKELFG